MADEAEQPLLARGAESSSRRQIRDMSPSPSRQQVRPFELSNESTPLLARRDNGGLLAYGTDTTQRRPSIPESVFSHRSSKKSRSWLKWPVVFISVLLAIILAVLVFAFAAPAAVRRYAEEAAVLKPRHLSIDSSTADGLRARIQGEFVIHANRAPRGAVRNLGRFATWIGREVETGPSEVEVYLPEYGNVLVGTVSVPPIKVNIRNGHTNQIDILADLTAGDLPRLRAVAMDWVEERLGRLRIKGKADLRLKSGLLSLGMQTVSGSIVFEEADFPAQPHVKVNKLIVRDNHRGSMEADASLTALVDFPFAIRIPPLGFKALVPNCYPGEPYIAVADVGTEEIQIQPGLPTAVNVNGVVKGLSDELTRTCPGKNDSPLDFLVRSYVNGLKTTIYVRGADTPSSDTPPWVVDFLKNVTVPLHFTGHTFDNLIRNFTMSDAHFSLPDPFANPDSPEAQPKVSAAVKVVIELPKQLNLTVTIPRIRADADVFYKGSKLGVLEMHKWQPANSTHLLDPDGTPSLYVNFTLTDAPLRVTNEAILTDIIQDLIFLKKPVQLHVTAAVDTEVATGMGDIAVRGLPAEGNVHVKPLNFGPFDRFRPQVESMELGPTTESSALVRTKLNMTNPTKYSVTVPMVDFLLVFNTTPVAHITTHDVSIVPGVTTGIPVDFLWSPLDVSGPDGVSAGRDIVTRYISGYNTTVTVQTHRGTVPAMPKLGEALSKLGIEVQVPKMSIPRSPDSNPDDDSDGPHFIQSAMYVHLPGTFEDLAYINPRKYPPNSPQAMHLISSTAEFIISSPLPKTAIEITWVNASAFYGEQHEAMSHINYDIPFNVPSGISHSPQLPVDVDLESIGYNALKKALGGTLKMNTFAEAGVRIGNYKDIIRYKGQGLSAHVRL